MRFFFRKRRNKKAVASKDSTRQRPPHDVTAECEGYNPYDTMPGVPREKFGLRRRHDGKWSF